MNALQTVAADDKLTRPSGGSTHTGSARRLRLPRSAGWLGAVPLLVFVAVVFGLPAGTMVFGAFMTPESTPGGARFTGANMSASLHGPYVTALIGSIKLSAVSALIAAVVGLPIAHAVVTSRFRALREAILAGAGVLTNFGGVPLAFAFVATLGNAGVLTTRFHLLGYGWNLYGFWGLTLVYLYFLIPLMVLTLAPALEGLRRHWREAAHNNGANAFRYWTHVALPILMPSLLGGYVLLFGTAFSAYATAAAMVGSSVPLVTMQIADALSGDVLVGQDNVALALGVDMVLVAGLVMAVQVPLQRRSSRWLA